MATGKKRILIVDADEQALIRLERALEDSNFATTTTWDASEAARLLQSSAYDMVVIGDHPVIRATDLLAHLNPEEAQCFVLPSDAAFAATCLDRVHRAAPRIR